MNIDHKTPCSSHHAMSGQICFAKGCNWGPIWGSLGYYAKKGFERKTTSENASRYTTRKLLYNLVGELFHRGYGGIPGSRYRRKFLRMKSLATCVQTLLLLSLLKVIQYIFCQGSKIVLSSIAWFWLNFCSCYSFDSNVLRDNDQILGRLKSNRR